MTQSPRWLDCRGLSCWDVPCGWIRGSEGTKSGIRGKNAPRRASGVGIPRTITKALHPILALPTLRFQLP